MTWRFATAQLAPRAPAACHGWGVPGSCVASQNKSLHHSLSCSPPLQPPCCHSLQRALCCQPPVAPRRLASIARSSGTASPDTTAPAPSTNAHSSSAIASQGASSNGTAADTATSTASTSRPSNGLAPGDWHLATLALSAVETSVVDSRGNTAGGDLGQVLGTIKRKQKHRCGEEPRLQPAFLAHCSVQPSGSASQVSIGGPGDHGKASLLLHISMSRLGAGNQARG